MKEPDYKRAFETEDFRGYFTWTKKLSELHGGNLYHACHRDELEEVLANEELGLRSQWSLQLPQHGLWHAPGVWTGLNYFQKGNLYGPFVLEFPLSVLHGKHFMVFRRTGGRKRYFFVQYEARIPIYSFGKKLWRKVDPYGGYFKKRDSTAIWDIVLTQPLSIKDAIIKPVNHPKCISEKCNGSTVGSNRRALKEIASLEFTNWLKTNVEYAAFLERFRVAEGLSVELPDVDDDE